MLVRLLNRFLFAIGKLLLSFAPAPPLRDGSREIVPAKYGQRPFRTPLTPRCQGPGPGPSITHEGPGEESNLCTPHRQLASFGGTSFLASRERERPEGRRPSGRSRSR